MTENIEVASAEPVKGVAIVAKNLDVFISSGWGFGKKQDKQILHGVNMYAEPGKLLGIMGPSGSGKTTLLHSLCQRVKQGRIVGDVLFNSYPRNRSFIKKHCKFVMDETKQYESLTVKETLDFTATFKLTHMSKEEKNAKVEQLISDFGLQKCRNTLVGGVWRKGLSSGELKRLSIAVELVDDPHLILLDEPTSGLDSSLAWDLTLLLSKLARQGRTIVCTVHQPRSQAFNVFDSLLVMQNGRVAFQGPPKEVRNHFEEIGFEVDANYNPSDFLTTLCTNSKSESDPIYMAFNGSKAFENLNQSLDRVLAEYSDESEVEKVNSQDAVTCGETVWKFGPLVWRQMLLTWRNPVMRFAVVGINFFDAFLIGGIFWQLRKEVNLIEADRENIITQEHVDSAWGQYYINGTDGEGLRPILDIFDSGVDGTGSRPLFQMLGRAESQDDEIDFPVFMECVHQKFNLSSIYPENRFSAVGDLLEDWTPPEDFVDPAQIVSSTLTTIQTIHFLAQSDWSEAQCFLENMPKEDELTHRNPLSYLSPEKYKLKRPSSEPLIDLEPEAEYLTWWMGLFNGTYDLVDPLFTCAGLPPLEPLFTTTPTLPPSSEPPLSEGIKRLIEWILSIVDVKLPSYPWSGCNDDTSDLRRSLESPDDIIRSSLGSENARILLQNNEERRRIAKANTDTNRSRRSNLMKADRTLVNPETSSDLTVDHAINRILLEANQCEDGVEESCGPIGEFVNTVQNGVEDLTTSLGAMFNYAGAMFFITGTLMFACYYVILSFAQERSVVNREVFFGYFPRWMYYLARNLADLPFQIIPTCVFATIVHFVAGLNPTFPSFFGYMLSCCCVTLASTGYSYFLACLFPKMEMGVVMAPVSLTVSSAIAGFFLRDEQIPTWIAWMRYISVYRWGFFGSIMSQFPPGGSFGVLSNEGVLSLTGVTSPSYWVPVGANITLSILYRILGLTAFQFLWKDIGLQ